jgi:hypothetical protein
MVCLEKGGVSGRKKISLKNDFSGYMFFVATPRFLNSERQKL